MPDDYEIIPIPAIVLDQSLGADDRNCIGKKLFLASGMVSHRWAFVTNSDQHARKTLRLLLTQKLEGHWEEDRDTIQASVSLKCIVGRAGSANLAHDFAVGIQTLPQVQYQTTQHRFYADVNMLTSQPDRDGTAFLEFAYNFAFLARARR